MRRIIRFQGESTGAYIEVREDTFVPQFRTRRSGCIRRPLYLLLPAWGGADQHIIIRQSAGNRLSLHIQTPQLVVFNAVIIALAAV